MARMTRSYFRDLVTTPDVEPLIPGLAALAPEEPAAYASVLCARLLARSFATPDDVRIASWAHQIARGLPPELLESFIRATLGSNEQVGRIPAAQILGLQIYIIRALVQGSGLQTGDVEELLVAAEPLVREVARQIQHSLTEGIDEP